MDILIVDDHPIFSVGLKEFLLSDNERLEIALAEDFSSARKILEKAVPRLILLDLDLGKECGFEVLDLLKREFSGIKIANLSANENAEDICSCMQKGAVGYIPKSSPPEMLLKAIDLLQNGGSYFPSSIIPYLSGCSTTSLVRVADKLTARQQDIFNLVKTGKSNKVIAMELGIAEGTVKLHMSTILNKLEVSNRSEAIARYA